MIRIRCAALAALLLVTSEPGAAGPREWFVAEGGRGPGSPGAPLGRIQDALSAAMPGDTVTIRAGTFREPLRTVRNGSSEAPITVRAEPGGGPVVVTVPGTVLEIEHAHIVIEDLVFDGQYASQVAVAVRTGGDFLVLRRVEVKRSGRDCVDLAAPTGVLIENSRIHHCLNPADGRTDAHGIVAGPVRDLTVRGTTIHTFSGDGIQMDPARNPAAWDGVTVEGSRIWLAPLARAENGFAEGAVPGENAIDTKTPDTGPRSRLIVRDTLAWGFRGAIENQAAFNLKENIDATIDGVTVWDSDIAFRLRGPTTRPGAWIVVQNSVVEKVATAVRYENDIENLRMWNNTFGLDIGRPFHAAASRRTGLDVRNLLFLGARVPAEAFDRSNLAVGADSFADAAAGDYHLTPRSPAVDAGAVIAALHTDRDGRARPIGNGPDIGAYEWSPSTFLGVQGARREPGNR